MSDLLNLTAQRLIDENLWVGADASDEDKKKKRYYSLRKSLIESVIEAARKHVTEQNLDNEQFEDLALKGISVIDDLQYALLPKLSHSPSDWNFWIHVRDPGQLIHQDKKPYMARDTVEECTTQYLRLPYRAPLLERTLVDVLVALEMYAYGEEMVAPRPAYLRWLPARSPLHQQHAILGYISGVFWNGLVLLGLAYLISNFLPSIIGMTAANWAAGILIGLFVLAFCLATLFLPYYWWQQSKARRQVQKLMSMMIQVYCELGSEGALSTKRIREVVSRAGDGGVVWPGPLYAILDDNIGRTGLL